MRARKKVPVGLSVGQSVGRRIWHRCWGLEKTFDSLFKIFILTPRRHTRRITHTLSTRSKHTHLHTQPEATWLFTPFFLL